MIVLRQIYVSSTQMFCERDAKWCISGETLTKMYFNSLEILTIFHENRRGETRHFYVKTSGDGIVLREVKSSCNFSLSKSEYRTLIKKNVIEFLRITLCYKRQFP